MRLQELRSGVSYLYLYSVTMMARSVIQNILLATSGCNSHCCILILSVSWIVGWSGRWTEGWMTGRWRQEGMRLT